MSQAKIIVKVVSQYGVKVIVPVCPSAQLFADIAGTKTITKPCVEAIKQLGYKIEVEQVLETV